MSLSEEDRIKKNLMYLTPLSPEILQKMHETELMAIAKYEGTIDELESALGFLRLGYQIGWKPLAIVHSKKTFRKYESILNISAKELFPEDTPASKRSLGYKVAKTLSNFWKAVSGDTKIENRRVFGAD